MQTGSPREATSKTGEAGQTQVLILAGIVILIALAGGIFFLGRVTAPKPQPQNVAAPSPQPSPTPSPTTTPDEIANWKTYKDSLITFKYPPNLYAKSGAQFGNEHIVTLVSNPDTDYRSGEFIVDSGLRGNLADYNTAVKTYEAVTNPQINNINGGIVISGTISNQMVSSLNVRYALLKYKSGAILIKNEKFTSVVDDKTFNQILSTFRFLP